MLKVQVSDEHVYLSDKYRKTVETLPNYKLFLEFKEDVDFITEKQIWKNILASRSM
jgi:hypothetical protein